MKKSIKKNYLNYFDQINTINLGKHSSWEWLNDPKHLVFSLSRYKFVSKLFFKFENVLEIGAGDGFKSQIVKQTVKSLTLSDNSLINYDRYHSKSNNYSNCEFILHDFIKKKLKKKYDGIYLLDVFEHISKKKENIFIKNISSSLKKNGSLIIGIPSLESQKYASSHVKKEHINCKTKNELNIFLKKYFKNVFMFSMNDEVVHTGFDQMSNYIIALCLNKK